MDRFNINARTAGLAVCSAMAAALLAGCSGQPPLASAGAPPVASAANASQADKDLAKLESRVAKAPQNAGARVDLAQSYLALGRFDSAATTFEDALSLGETSPRAGLGLALAYIGSGRNVEALTVLSRWRDQIPASDYGLAIALAGQPAQGVAVLTDALRGGDDTPKLRQNLAYAYALDGRWGESRVVASQDVPADQIDARMNEWASRVRPEQYQVRVAGLLGAPVRSDPGQPTALALNGVAHAGRFAQAEPAAVAALSAGELPPVQSVETMWGASQPADEPASTPAAEPAVVPAAFATSAPAAVPLHEGRKFVAQPAAEHVSPISNAFAESFAGAGEARTNERTHLVQLGSFRTLAGAQRAWGIYLARNSALKDHTMRITEAEVRGRRYFRVAAEGFDRGAARDLCSTVKRRGDGCFAYSETRVLPGALPDSHGGGAMLARRR